MLDCLPFKTWSVNKAKTKIQIVEKICQVYSEFDNYRYSSLFHSMVKLS